MAFWNTDWLKQQCREHELIVPYREDRALRCAYELGVGSEAYITSSDSDTTHLDDKAKVRIPPGQFGLLITHETVYVPPTAIAFISIRARIKFQGLVNVSGFHVDPGFRGKLKFAVYNAGSAEVVLDQDERVFMIWYADLNATAPDPYPPVPVAPSVITSEDVRRLTGEVASPAELKKQIDDVKNDYDKRIQSIELSEKMLRWLVGALMLALLGTMFRAGVFDRNTEQKARAPALQPDQPAPKDKGKVDTQQPEERQADALPHVGELEQIVEYGSFRLGAWIAGGAALIALSIFVSALIIRSRLRPPQPQN